MAIARYENITVNHVVNGVNDFGEYTTTLTKWFETRARVQDVKNSVAIGEKDRVYSDLVKFTLNYTPWLRQIVDDQPLYSIKYRGFDWRITDCIESNDRMNVTLLCYRNDPVTTV